MTDRDEKIIQRLEVMGVSIGRAAKKLKAKEYAMLEKYLTLAKINVVECMKLIRNGGKNHE